LHVYDLNEDFQKANQLLSFSWESLALGGAFHVGVEVFGSEWSFGSSGVQSTLPRSVDGHVYNSSVCLGQTDLSPHKFVALMHQMCKQWRGGQYHLVSHNCCSFATELCSKLDTEPVPAWVTRVPRLLDAGLWVFREGQKAGNQAMENWRTATSMMASTGTTSEKQSLQSSSRPEQNQIPEDSEIPHVPASAKPDFGSATKRCNSSSAIEQHASIENRGSRSNGPLRRMRTCPVDTKPHTTTVCCKTSSPMHQLRAVHRIGGA